MKKYLSLLLIIISIFIFNSNVSAVTYKRGIVTGSATIKSSPSSSASAVKTDTGGSASLSKPEPVEVVGESGNFYQIKFCISGFFYTGYIDKSKITVSTYQTDDAYEKGLINKGFPADYARKLAILHAIHPNWSFTPSYTGGVTGGMDFATAIKGEAYPVDKNLTNSKNTSLRSTADGAYKNGTWKEFSGGGWFAASEQTIAFFLDPRNFLDEAEIFMFENLGYNPTTQTKDTVSKVLGGTFMANPFECGVNATQCAQGTHYYADTFMSAGIDKKVSPVHLASRVVQEQGSKGSALSSGAGYDGQYIGYYNFFNINANGSTTADVILNGLKYAKDRNWDNQHYSIYDGSRLIANSYVGRGQSTGYYQKFNTITPSYFSNQYMQNVKAPFSEAYNTYSSYYKTFSSQTEWDNATYDFLIPIYQNMGSFTTLDASGNADATLKNMTVTGCNLNIDFQSSAYTYECYAPKATTEINISATTTNGGAKLSNPGTVKLTSDEQVATLTVTALNGSTATYTINIHRIETDGYKPNEILNGIGLKAGDTYASNVQIGSDVSHLINSIKNKYHFAEITIKEANGTTITSGVIKTGQTITIKNGGITNTFKLVVYGDVAGDGTIDILDLLLIQKHLVKSKTISGEYWNAADVNKSGTVDILDLLLVQKHLLNQYQITQE